MPHYDRYPDYHPNFPANICRPIVSDFSSIVHQRPSVVQRLFGATYILQKKNRRMGWSVLTLCSRKNVRLLPWMICSACMIGFRRITATSFWFATFYTTCLSDRRKLPNSGCVIYPSVNRRFIFDNTISKNKRFWRVFLPRKLSS